MAGTVQFFFGASNALHLDEFNFLPVVDEAVDQAVDFTDLKKNYYIIFKDF